MQAIKRGDHIVVGRGPGGAAYKHHGIAVSTKRAIHFDGAPGKSKSQATIRYVSLKDFADGGTVRVQPHNQMKFSGDEIARRAQSQLGKGNYKLLGRNCEHFASWCADDRSESDQVGMKWSMVVGGIAGVVGVAVAPAGLAALAVAGVGAAVVSGLGWMFAAEDEPFGN